MDDALVVSGKASLADPSFSIRVTDNKDLSSIVDDTLTGIEYVEQEAKKVYEAIRAYYMHPDREMDPTMLLALSPIAEHYLELLSKQSENRIKTISAAAGVLKANQAAIVNQVVNSQSDIFATLDGTPDPLAQSFHEIGDVQESTRKSLNSSPETSDYYDQVLSKFEEVDEGDVIHSPDYLLMKRK